VFTASSTLTVSVVITPHGDFGVDLPAAVGCNSVSVAGDETVEAVKHPNAVGGFWGELGSIHHHHAAAAQGGIG